MHVRKFLSIFLVSLVFVIAGCGGGGSSSGIGGDESAPDTDGDGIVNEHDGDIDGDGIPNQNDDDVDGDGVTNDQDGDDDNDGIADDNDSTPEGPPSGNGDSDNDGIPDKDDPDTPSPAQCTSAKIIVPNNEIQTGQTGVRVKWDLLPTGCELTAEKNVTIQITAFNQWANPDTRYSGKKTVGEGSAGIIIPNNCNWDRSTTKKITYDFSAIGIALGDRRALTPVYIQDVTHPVGQGSCENVEKDPVVALDRISHHKTANCSVESSGTVSCTGSTSSVGGTPQYYYVWTKVTEALPIGYYQSAPTWNATTGSDGIWMNIYLSNGSKKKTIIYNGGGSSEWNALLAANAGWIVRTDYKDLAGAGWENRPNPGNFILKITSPATTISKYHIPTPSNNAVDPAIAVSNIMREKNAGVSCLQQNPTSATVTCEGTSEYWLWANNRQATPQPLSSYSHPSWDTTPSGKMSIYLAPIPLSDATCTIVVKQLQAAGHAEYKAPPKKSAFYYTDNGTGRDNFNQLAKAGCKVGTTLEEAPSGGHDGNINTPKPGNFILKLGTQSSITVRKFVAGN